MQIDPFFGPHDASVGWVPSLRYTMRRVRILELLKPVQPKTLLEVGCGAGMLLAELSNLGFSCVGLETSEAAFSLSKKISQGARAPYQVVDCPDSSWQGKFSTVSAFDVLEHIQDDEGALRLWREWLQDDGLMILSVPAHSKRWGPGDEWAGHYRRYDAAQFKALLLRCGLKIDHFECYGFPVANLSEWLGRAAYARMLGMRRGKSMTQVEATALSGIERRSYTFAFMFMRAIPIKWVIALGLLIQKIFRNSDLGSGYIVLASKR